VLERDQEAVVDDLAELVVLAVDPLLPLAAVEDVWRVREDEDEVGRVLGLARVDGEYLLDRVELEVELELELNFALVVEDDGDPPVLRVDLDPPLAPYHLAPLERVRADPRSSIAHQLPNSDRPLSNSAASQRKHSLVLT